MGFFSRLFNTKPNPIIEILAQGATVIDVRSPAEYSGGHVSGSMNIPLDQIPHKLPKIKKIKGAIVLCCASGMRSGNATSLLKSNHIDQVYNGGSWTKVNRLLNQ